MRRLVPILALVLVAILVAPVWSQVRRGGLLSPVAARRFGLTRAWYTQLEVDPGRSRLGYLTLHINSDPKLSHTVFEINYKGGKLEISDRGFDPFGRVLGVVGAKKLADEKVQELKDAKLEPKLTKHVVERMTLYAVSDRAIVQAIDAETGRTRWSTQVGRRRFPTLAAGANDKHVAVVNGSTLYILDEQTGEVAWQRRVANAPGAGPALSADMAFVPGMNGRMESYKLWKPKDAPYVYQSHGRAMIQPTVTDGSVAWPTDRGHLYVGHSHKEGIRFRLEANRTIVSEARYLPPNKLFVASVDGYVYGLQEYSGSVLWRFSTGEEISHAPVPIGDTVYVVTDRGTLFAVDEAGQEKWSTPRVRRFLSASKDRAYVIDTAGRLAILATASGGRIAAIPAQLMDVSLVNSSTDRIFIGTKTGVLQCLREHQLRWPIVHAGGVETKKDKKPPVVQQGPGAQPKPKPMGGDPFGGGGGDPFGGGGAGAGGAGAGGDPFGGGGDPAKPMGNQPPPKKGDPGDPFGGGGGDPFGGGGDGDPFGNG